MKEISEDELKKYARDYANTNGGAYFGDAYKHFMAGMKFIILLFPNHTEKDHEKFNALFEALLQRVFHTSDATTKIAIDEFVREYPIMLEFHNIEWYYKNV